MRLFIVCFVSMLLVTGCGFTNQKKEIENLTKCKFELEQIEKFELAGVPVDNLLSSGNSDLLKMPKILLALMDQRLPLNMRMNVQVENPTKEKASVNTFDYILLFEDVEVANGTMVQPLEVKSGEAKVVPFDIKGDVYELIQSKSDVFLNFIKGNSNQKAKLTLKVKPSFKIAGKLVKSPVFFNIDKYITKDMLYASK